MWFEDPQSLTLKYNLVNSMDLGGTGIWALSYEGTYKGVWETISNAYSGPLPEKSEIVKIWPNPVNGAAEIQFSLAVRANVTLKIYDMLGKERIVLVDEELEAGTYTEEFNSASFGQGVYFCALKTGKTTNTNKIVITKK